MNMMGFPGRQAPARPISPARSGVVTAIDIGSSKVACFIGKLEPGRFTNGRMPVRVVGIGHQVSRGIRGGLIVDMDAAEEAIRLAVDAAERMAGITVRDVIVNLSAGQLKSQTVSVRAMADGEEIEDEDLSRLVTYAQDHFQPDGRAVLHAIPVSYTVDGCRGIRDPRGMIGQSLGVEVHMVSALAGPLRNLELCVERCHLDVTGIIASPYASGLSCLIEDERELGTCLIDMGAGTTTLAVFHEGGMVFCDSVPVGGAHVTNDIARGLSTPIAYAERMKTLYGSALASPSDEREMIDVPQIGEKSSDVPNHLPRSILTGIIRPRLEETFELVRDRLEVSGFGRLAGRRVVLTGGASQMNGARELAGRILDRQARIGTPSGLLGLAESMAGPTFSTCAGLLSYASSTPVELTSGESAGSGGAGQFGRLGRWLKENF